MVKDVALMKLLAAWARRAVRNAAPRQTPHRSRVRVRKIPTPFAAREIWDAMIMFKLAEYLPPFPNATWTLVRQAG
jgi:hypothetical protein